jgi:hypothetical protein
MPGYGHAAFDRRVIQLAQARMYTVILLTLENIPLQQQIIVYPTALLCTGIIFMGCNFIQKKVRWLVKKSFKIL